MSSAVQSPKRRLVVIGLGSGVLATLALKLGWWRAQPEGVASIPAPARPSGTRHTDARTATDPQPVAKAPEPMTREWFLPHVQSKFDADMENVGRLPLELVQVSAATTLVDREHHVKYNSFTLLFRGPKDMPEESKVFRLRHKALGSLDLFLSTVGRHKDRVEYEAVFSCKV